LLEVSADGAARDAHDLRDLRWIELVVQPQEQALAHPGGELRDRAAEGVFELLRQRLGERVSILDRRHLRPPLCDREVLHAPDTPIDTSRRISGACRELN
jgi:hypothetical protein